MIHRTAIALLAVGLLCLPAPAGAQAGADPTWLGPVAALEAQPDGGVLVAGAVNCLSCKQSGVYVARYTASGDPDPTFGDQGRVVVPVGGNLTVTGLASDQSGRIHVAANVFATAAGPLGPGEFVLARITPGGRLDPEFGSAGVAAVSFDQFFGGYGLASRGHANGLVADGNAVIAAGTRRDPGGSQTAAARFLPSGELDPLFGSGGVASLRADPAADGDGATAIALRGDGRIVLAGGSGPTGAGASPHGALVLARLLPDGSPDPAFGSGGATTLGALESEGRLFVQASAVQVAPSEGLLVAGSSAGGLKPCSDFTIARLTANGQPESSFGSSGVVRASAGDCLAATDMALAPTGEIVASGQQGVTSSGAPGQATLGFFEQVTGAPAGVGDDGLVVPRIDAPGGGIGALEAAAGGFFAAGYIESEHCASPGGAAPYYACRGLAVMRLKAKGSLDRSFGRRGLVTDPGVCELAFSKPCAVSRRQLKRLVRGGLPRRAERQGKRMRIRLRCNARLFEPCRFRGALRIEGQRVARVRAKVAGGEREHVRLQPTASGWGPADARKGRLRVKLKTRHQGPVVVWRPLKLGTSR